VTLPVDFFQRDPRLVARELLGAVLVCRGPDGVAAGRIVETEAYLGPDDPASHAAVGHTARNHHLFGLPGHAYVYFIYGMHWCVNAVAGNAGEGRAVLIRALAPLEGLALMRRRRGEPRRAVDLANGPGKLCEALGIDRCHDGLPLTRPPLRIRPGPPVADGGVAVSPRIGIRKAADWPLRFFVRDDPHVSATPRGLPVVPYRQARP
jgi:DNA-3-methyladenine glycosylase